MSNFITIPLLVLEYSHAYRHYEANRPIFLNFFVATVPNGIKIAMLTLVFLNFNAPVIYTS